MGLPDRTQGFREHPYAARFVCVIAGYRQVTPEQPGGLSWCYLQDPTERDDSCCNKRRENA